MQNYDKAYELAREMHESDLYKNYCAAKEKAFANELNRDLYKKFVSISRAVNAAQLAGQQPSEELQQQFNQLMSVLALNLDVSNFMMAEHLLNQMMSDVFKILADAVDLNLDFLEQ